MDEGTKEMIQGIIHQAKILEELMKELESPLDEIQKRNLDDEMIHIDSALCTAQCLYLCRLGCDYCRLHCNCGNHCETQRQLCSHMERNRDRLTLYYETRTSG